MVLVLWVIAIYNGLVSMRQRVNQAFADVDVQLRQRHDLVPNLVETVKGYAAHERGTLDEVVKARNAAVAAQGPEQKAAAENMLSGALRQLFALSEAYPDLKANANFQQLQAELSDIENKIAAARRFFNNAVQEYNTGIAAIPRRPVRRLARFCAEGVLRSRRGAQDRRRGAAGEVLEPSACYDAQTLGRSAMTRPGTTGQGSLSFVDDGLRPPFPPSRARRAAE